MNNIGLVMLVRNEEAVLPRALRSVKDLIDTWTIIDTGSEDSTKEIVAVELEGIPGQLFEREWSDFGTNLTQMMEAAEDQAKWNLRLHADMTVDVHPGLWSFLDDDVDETIMAFNVGVQEGGRYFYRVPYLTRGGVPWRYIGTTHEYLAPTERIVRPLLGLTLHHHQDGAMRSDKFERDIELLRAGVEAEDPRAIFYTAQSLHNLGQFVEAIVMYERRVEHGGWEEEAWYSQFQIAKIKGDEDLLVEAWQRRPWRHEPLTEAARIVAEKGAEGDILFLERPASPPTEKMSS